MTILLIHEAETEFWQSVEYYERQQPGLGIRFKQEVDLYLAKISLNPLIAPLRKKKFRRVNLAVFKHYIAYIIRDDIIWVAAICHAHRKPEFWLTRL